MFGTRLAWMHAPMTHVCGGVVRERAESVGTEIEPICDGFCSAKRGVDRLVGSFVCLLSFLRFVGYLSIFAIFAIACEVI